MRNHQSNEISMAMARKRYVSSGTGFRAWARATLANENVVGKLAHICGKGDRNGKKKR